MVYRSLCSTLAVMSIILTMSNWYCADSVDSSWESKPNIVIILADDFGVGDIQALYPDNKIKTTNWVPVCH